MNSCGFLLKEILNAEECDPDTLCYRDRRHESFLVLIKFATKKTELLFWA